MCVSHCIRRVSYFAWLTEKLVKTGDRVEWHVLIFRQDHFRTQGLEEIFILEEKMRMWNALSIGFAKLSFLKYIFGAYSFFSSDYPVQEERKTEEKGKVNFRLSRATSLTSIASESVFSCWQITSKLIIPKICHKSFEPSATPWLLEGSWTNWRRIKETWRSLWSRMDQHTYALLQTRKR